MLILTLATALATAPTLTTPSSQDVQIQLRGDVYGARMDTPIRVRAIASASDPVSVLDANARALSDLASWVELSAQAVDLDDYGRFRLVVSAVDALPVRVSSSRASRPMAVSEALRRGTWSASDRVLAIGGALRASGVAVTAFATPTGEVVLGISCDDHSLNVDAVEHRWRSSSGETRVRWVVWDGQQPIGRVDDEGRLRGLEGRPPSGRALELVSARAPAFARSRAVPHQVSLRGATGSLSLVRHPDAAGWLSLAPERHLSVGLASAREHVRASGLLSAARRHTRGIADESARIDALIRLVQGAFVYEPGPVRTVPELLERGRGDCDQLSLVLGALLMELGYTEDELVIVSWPDHLGLAVRPKGAFPKNAAHLTLEDGRYVLVDVTHYVWTGDRLTSRWGRTSPKHGSQVTVRRLDRAGSRG